MKLKKTSFYLGVIVAVTLLIQTLLLSSVFRLIGPVKRASAVRPSKPLHQPRSRSLSNLQLAEDYQYSTNRDDAGPTRMREQSIVQRKMPKDSIEELERAPKQSNVNEIVSQQSRGDGDGTMAAGVRNNGVDTVLLGEAPVMVDDSPSTTESDNLDNDELVKNWEDEHLDLVKIKTKLGNILARSSPMEAYWKSLKGPPTKPGFTARDYVAHIQSLARKSNLKHYTDDFCVEGGEPLLECSSNGSRELTMAEEQGRNIMFTLRTTSDYHQTRLGVLFETWLTTLYPESLFIVTDSEDTEFAEQVESVGMHYINAKSGHTHCRSDLCCKAGVEMELLFQPENQHFDWLCHVDDDMYVHVSALTRQLAKFSPRSEPVYFGRSGSEWGFPRVVNESSTLGSPGQKYHFAVGGMYCLSRAMLEQAKQYLVGCHVFSASCNATQEPEDVTVGLIIGAVLKTPLTRTAMIWTHGLDLITSVPSPYIRDQIAFSNGFGSDEAWMPVPNVVFVPGALFSIDEDLTQFMSIHCHLYPTLHWCLDQKRLLVEHKKRRRKEGRKTDCICSWETYICCEVIKDGYFKTMAAEINYRETNRATNATSDPG